MFDRICIPAKYPEQVNFDLGQLAESLIFYREVILLVNYASLKGLLAQCEPEFLLRLLASGRLRIKYLNNMFGAICQNERTRFEQYDVCFISSETQKLNVALQKMFTELIGKRGKGRRLANRFNGNIQEISYDVSIAQQIRDELFEGTYIEDYISRRLRRTLAGDNSEVSKGLVFKFGDLIGKGYRLETNLDLEEVSRFSEGDNIGKPSSIIAHYGATIADLSIWSKLGAEVAVDSNRVDILQSRFELLLNRRKDSLESIEKFQDFIFDDSKAVRETINSGRHKFEELEPILEQSDKFSGWLKDKSPDVDLVKAYFEEVTADSWIDKIPPKAMRWSLFTLAGLGLDALGAGGIGTLAGVSLGAFDSFLLDKLVKGWKPNQFVEGPLKRIVK